MVVLRELREVFRQRRLLPVDIHELLALCAPRPLYIGVAAGDVGSDPMGQFLAAVNASPVLPTLRERGVWRVGDAAATAAGDEYHRISHPLGPSPYHAVRLGSVHELRRPVYVPVASSDGFSTRGRSACRVRRSRKRRRCRDRSCAFRLVRFLIQRRPPCERWRVG